MDKKAFSAGVVPGGLTTSKEIKILICYLLLVVGEPVSHPLLLYTLSKEGLVNYFECADAIGELLESGGIEQADDVYSLTAVGRNIAENLFSSVPLSIREQALEQIDENLRMQKNRRQHRTEIHKTENGYTIRCTLSDDISDLFTMELYAPSRRHALCIERNFIMNGEQLIRSVIEQLTADSAEE
ncbi:MAG: DUF4364 family protein [Oscillospiraceae bacterium]|nr:DUF4364 family protein [Oscillospiraceae bacterium]